PIDTQSKRGHRSVLACFEFCEHYSWPGVQCQFTQRSCGHYDSFIPGQNLAVGRETWTGALPCTPSKSWRLRTERRLRFPHRISNKKGAAKYEADHGSYFNSVPL